MWPFVTDTPSAVQTIMLIAGLIMGLSHLFQPRMWARFFVQLRETGAGVVANGLINIAPAAVIVGLHQVWSGPAVVLTVYGWLLLLKTALTLTVPAIGERSLSMARRGDNGFRIAGAGLLIVAIACALQLAGVAVL